MIKNEIFWFVIFEIKMSLKSKFYRLFREKIHSIFKSHNYVKSMIQT